MKKPRPAKSLSESNSRTDKAPAKSPFELICGTDFYTRVWSDEREAEREAAERERWDLATRRAGDPGSVERVKELSFFIDSYYARPQTMPFDEWWALPRKIQAPYVAAYQRTKRKRDKALNENQRKRLLETRADMGEYLELLRSLAAAVAGETEAVQDVERNLSGQLSGGPGFEILFGSGPEEHLRPERMMALATELKNINDRRRKRYAEGQSLCMACGKSIPQPRGKRLFCSVTCAARDRKRRYLALKSTGKKLGRPKSVP